MILTLKTPPVSEPVSLQEVKDYMRVITSAEDTLINTLIISARKYIENYTGNLLGKQEWVLKWHTKNGQIYLPYIPILEIVSVKDKDNKEVDYRVVYGSEPMIIETPTYEVEIDFWAGWEDIPETFKLAILRIITFYFENRLVEKLPVEITESLNQLRMWKI